MAGLIEDSQSQPFAFATQDDDESQSQAFRFVDDLEGEDGLGAPPTQDNADDASARMGHGAAMGVYELPIGAPSARLRGAVTYFWPTAGSQSEG